MFVLVVLCFPEHKNCAAFTLAHPRSAAMRSFHERKRHNEVAMGLSFVAVALLVLGFMGMAQHLELTAF
jgi:hypothetical protein